MKKVNASHILVKTESEANVILYDVKNGKSFEEIAKEKSLCPSFKRKIFSGVEIQEQAIQEGES